jgi:hypothetical protein
LNRKKRGAERNMQGSMGQMVRDEYLPRLFKLPESPARFEFAVGSSQVRLDAKKAIPKDGFFVGY